MRPKGKPIEQSRCSRGLERTAGRKRKRLEGEGRE